MMRRDMVSASAASTTSTTAASASNSEALRQKVAAMSSTKMPVPTIQPHGSKRTTPLSLGTCWSEPLRVV
ncbi:hypothetical protein D3C86_2160370 [compost metagenome]